MAKNYPYWIAMIGLIGTIANSNFIIEILTLFMLGSGCYLIGKNQR